LRRLGGVPARYDAAGHRSWHAESDEPASRGELERSAARHDDVLGNPTDSPGNVGEGGDRVALLRDSAGLGRQQFQSREGGLIKQRGGAKIGARRAFLYYEYNRRLRRGSGVPVFNPLLSAGAVPQHT
jgi:hypothetical protein